MPASDVQSRTVVGLDANIFIYHFAGRSDECSAILKRVEAGELSGITTEGTMLEVAHRLMMLEAVQQGFISGGNPARKLRSKPELIGRLRNYYSDCMAIRSMGVKVLPVPPDQLRISQPLRERFGLLTNDSLLAATLLHHGVTTLITADRDFTRVTSLDVVLVDVERA
jgi:predicted nucleic acid-binding protein